MTIDFTDDIFVKRFFFKIKARCFEQESLERIGY